MSHIDPEKGTLAYTKAKPSPIANPASLGLFSFASTTFMLSLFNLQTRSITTPNAVVGMAIFCGGLAQFLAGMWEFPRNNTFGATAFTSYGAFWMSYATILIPGSGILSAYKEASELESALGIYLLAWFMVTFFLFIASLRKSIAFIALFGCLAITFALLAAGALSGKVAVNKAGGAVGTVTAFVAYYIGVSDLLAAEDNAPFQLPIGKFAKRVD
jgi:succinate-acetate transporter protein